MIHVGFILNFQDQGWIGGINYYHSLIDAVMSLPDRKIDPVIITGTNSELLFINDYPDVEVIETKIFDTPWQYARKCLKKGLSYDPFIERIIKKYHLDIISHNNYISHNSNVPSLGWIPDFQHKHLTEFFSKKDIMSRDKSFENICRMCSRVIFSSFNAKEDAEKYYPDYKSKYDVLHFVSAPVNLTDVPDIVTLKQKYSISMPYFLIPNQFWVHKNHLVIIEALNILKSERKDVCILCTGNTHDYRNPKYFNSIMKLAAQSGVLENFIVLGIVPYVDLIGLMMNSLSLINPSLFEGWSTAVEEAKSLDLSIILSDIPVHREQNPAKGIFFNPKDARSLANIMWDVWTSGSNCCRISEMDSLRYDFGRQYESIVLKTLNSE